MNIGNTGESDLIWQIDEEPIVLRVAGAAPVDARQAPTQTGVSTSRRIASPEAVVFSEDFEGGVVPPAGWTRQAQNAAYSWKLMTVGTPHAGSFSADVEYDPALVPQNEWLLSPAENLTAGTLSLWSLGSLYWCRDTYDNCDLEVWIVVGPTAGDGDDIYVGAADTAWTADWTWAQSVFDLTSLLPGGPVRVGFRYVGTDGAQIALDDILLDGEVGGGEPQPCDNPADVPWLSVDPTSGTTAGGGVTPVTVTFDSTGLAVGAYTANLCITSNDPDAGPGNETELVIVPVTLIVGEPQGAMIAGFVFLDLNENGWRNAEEQAGLAGVTVTLSKDGAPIATYWSNAPTGWYHFLGQEPGNYCVEYPVPAGYVPTSPTKVCFTLGEDDKIVNFGVIPARAAIGDQVFFDANSNGVFDAGDYGIGNVTVDLWTASGGAPGAVVATTTTAADGTYLFANILPGAYFVQVTDTHGELTGLSLTTAGNPLGPITVVHMQTYLDADFGYNLVCSSTRGAISGRVWHDVNGDRVQDAGEAGIAGVQACAEPLSYLATRCRTTNSAGYFYMCVPKGTYLVAPLTDVAPLAEMTPTTPEFYLPVVIRPGGSFLTAFFGYK